MSLISEIETATCAPKKWEDWSVVIIESLVKFSRLVFWKPLIELKEQLILPYSEPVTERKKLCGGHFLK